MADNDVEGTLRAGFDGSEIEKGIKKTADETVKQTGRMSKALNETKKEVDQLGAASENAAKKVDKATLTPNARAANKRNKTWATTMGTPEERANATIAVLGEQRGNAAFRASLQRRVNLENEMEKRVTANYRTELSQRRRLEEFFGPWAVRKREAKAAGMSVSGMLTNNINTAIGTSNLRYQMGQAQAGGGSATSVWQQAMNAAIARSNATNANFFAAQNQQVPAQTGPGFFRRNIGRIGSAAASAIGIGTAGFGAFAAVRGAQSVIESTQLATSYNRQRVAASELAGSQAKLNQFLQAYEEASGGAIEKTTELANVTRLLATGFAKTVPDVERFVRATRGAAIALGKPEDYIIQETQLAISNTSQKRLDQVGLGIKEVNDRIEELRENNKSWTRETAFQESVIGLMEEKYGNLTETLEGQATGLERLRKAWADLFLTMGQNASSPVNRTAGALANFLQPGGNVPKEQNQRQIGAARTNDQFYSEKGFLNVSIYDVLGALTGRSAAQVKAQHMQNAGLGAGGGGFQDYAGFGDVAPRAPTGAFAGYEDDQVAVIRDFNKRFADMERDFSEQRLDALRQYEETRANIIRDYGKQMAREEEDFQRNRARSLRDYERSIVDSIRDAREREEEMRDDLADRIAEAREDSEERLADMQEEYNEKREEAEKEHRDNLMKAAGQLDAIAVLEERKRFAKQQKQAEEQYDKQRSKEKENLEERIEDAQEAFEEQLDDARKAEEKRLEDMRVNRERQLADEDEDRAIRLQRAKEDHDDQLDELARQHSLRLEQIREQEEEARIAMNEAWEQALFDAGVYVKGLQEKMEERDKMIEDWFDKVITRLEKELSGEDTSGYRYDPRTGPQIPSSYGYGVSPNAPALTMGGSTNNKTITVQSGAVQVFTTPGFELMVGDLVEEKMLEIMEGS